MGIFSQFSDRFFHSFRELFVHHYGALKFRAEILALVIGVNHDIKVENFSIIKKIAMDIYHNDEERANILLFTTKEIVNNIKSNTLSIDTLVHKIQQKLKHTPRYANKIDVESLKEILSFTHDEDVFLYQQNILEFLQTLKEETLTKNKKIKK